MKNYTLQITAGPGATFWTDVFAYSDNEAREEAKKILRQPIASGAHTAYLWDNEDQKVAKWSIEDTRQFRDRD